MKTAFVILVAMLALVGCARHQASDKPPVQLAQNMYEQPKYKAQSESRFFADGLSMRPPVEGTVARGWLREDSAYYFGKIGDKLVARAPVAMTMERLQRGRQRFDIYCSPCHGRIGTGQGIMAKKGMQAPPSYHEQRLRDVGDSHIFDVITNGLRNMPPYKYQIPVDDRWSIVGYVRALQRSQKATLEDVPLDLRDTIK
ncbi:MAG: cytochrome c [candidate division Zixibacteria bacterium]|nr:cytochrome c [candidate division Zixibacteria bacterium]